MSKEADPARLAVIALRHWEGDENGTMEPLMGEAREAELVGSDLSIALNAHGFGVHTRTQGFTDGQTLELGKHTLRFLETPHVHHRDSMMVVEESTNSLFPSDLYLQPGEQPPISSDMLAAGMIDAYRSNGSSRTRIPFGPSPIESSSSRRPGFTPCTAPRSPATALTVLHGGAPRTGLRLPWTPTWPSPPSLDGHLSVDALP